MLKTIFSEIKKLFTKKFFIVAIAAITIVPMLYSYLYLNAFWDPYSRLDKLPVAVVNQDMGDEKHPKGDTVGDKFISHLKDNDEVKWVFTSEKDAMSGLDSDKYYAAFIIPKDFTKETFSGVDSNPKKVKLIYCNNEKKNFLAAQVNSKVVRELKDRIESSVSEEYTKAAFDALYSAEQGMKKASDGSKKIVSATKKLSQAAPQIRAASKKFTASANALSRGSEEINRGIMASETTIANSAKGYSVIGDNLKVLISKNPKLALDPAVQQIISELKNQEIEGNKSKESIQRLMQGLNEYSKGVNEFAIGAGQFSEKIQSLPTSLDKLNTGISSMSKKIEDGAEQLSEGFDADSETIAGFVASPVKLEEERIHRVDNYGTGFAPYFIPLSLWVGAIMMFFVINPFFRRDENKNRITQVIGKYGAYGFVGILQGLLVSLAVLHLGLEPIQSFKMVGFIVLISLVFVAIMQFLITFLGDAGRIIAIILLILQLTSCGGTFPMELLPDFFKAINPFMPFTYAVEALRELVSGDNMAIVLKDAIILGVAGIVALVLTTLLVNQGRKITEMMERRKAEAQNA